MRAKVIFLSEVMTKNYTFSRLEKLINSLTPQQRDKVIEICMEGFDFHNHNELFRAAKEKFYITFTGDIIRIKSSGSMIVRLSTRPYMPVLKGEIPDYRTVENEIRRQDNEYTRQIGGITYLAQTIARVRHGDNLQLYAAEIKRLFLLRKLDRLFFTLREKARVYETDPFALISEVQQEMWQPLIKWK